MTQDIQIRKCVIFCLQINSSTIGYILYTRPTYTTLMIYIGNRSEGKHDGIILTKTLQTIHSTVVISLLLLPLRIMPKNG